MNNSMLKIMKQSLENSQISNSMNKCMISTRENLTQTLITTEEEGQVVMISCKEIVLINVIWSNFKIQITASLQVQLPNKINSNKIH